MSEALPDPGAGGARALSVDAPPDQDPLRAQGASSASTYHLQRHFTSPDLHPYEEIAWEARTAAITNERGEVIFEQRDVEFPASWSQTATNVVVSKYFKGPMGTPQRERSLRQVVDRVVATLSDWGWQGGYFRDEVEREAFRAELAYLLVHQYAAFNSPVWFNLGIEPRPQCSACFILSIEDTMESILEWYKKEGMIFKWGSGSGLNVSPLRSSREQLSGGGTPSGPVSFMRAADVSAGTIKSGGKTRRAAKMLVLNADHPDILDFIRCKADEERKAWALIEQGYDPGFNVPGGAYDSVFFQNANHSVRATDDFMQAVVDDGEWWTRYVTTGERAECWRARELMKEIAQAAWVCGDPGLQFHDVTNRWHTCAETEPIVASNPCSEFLFLNDTACNLSSLNLVKFRRADGSFEVAAFQHAVHVLITAQEILVDNSSYPTQRIAGRSHDYRPLGLGYANLGALLMSLGLPYDSDGARAVAGAITALMTGQAYLTSAQLASRMGPFPGYPANRESTQRVLAMHREQVDRIDRDRVPAPLRQAAVQVWEEACEESRRQGVRNAQVSVLAPTGTISFMMDCDTTGVEPDIALVKYKRLVGGGMMKIVNHTVPLALQHLGYSEAQVSRILEYIDRNDTIEGAPDLDEAHLPVFDCAFKPANGVRSIHYMGHVRMMAATQPFLSGGISKTVNMPHDVTADDIMHTYIEAWRLGLKCIAVYRDGCKRSQPLSTRMEKEEERGKGRPVRRRLPDERQSITHKFSVAGHEGYITVGMYEDGRPGEIFITMSKQGSTISGLMDAFATAISLSLQYGVPLGVLVRKFSHMRFEPAGFTNNRQIRMAKSVVDYLFRWLALKFLEPEEQEEISSAAALEGVGDPVEEEAAAGLTQEGNGAVDVSRQERWVFETQSDAPPCHDCGSLMVRNGACYKCVNCGATSGCS